MSVSLQDKVAIVTGGTKGIGLAICRLLLEKDARVFLTARTQEAVRSAIQCLEKDFPGKVSGATCDVRDYPQVLESIDRAAGKWGGIDFLINNAGVGIFAGVADLTPEEWRQVIETNLNGVFYNCHAAIPHLRRRGGGYIINISSLAGKNPFKGGAAYNASKFGLNGFSEAILQDLRYDNIKVSYVMPGSVNTGFGRHAAGEEASWKLAPEDVAQVVMDLLMHHPRSLPSCVEMRPSKPAQK
jgi:NAD(P)-dependent dehydrogenase (short-subunit alcohol dehydrogenase family)